MALSKYLRLYEGLFPDQPMDNDPRAPAIQAEMRAVIKATDNKEAVAAIEWWGWSSNQQAVAFVIKARHAWPKIK